MARPGAHTQFKPGQSGNPRGRPKRADEPSRKLKLPAIEIDVDAVLDSKTMTKLARSHAPAAFRTLVDCLRDPRHRVAAATALLDRGYGKPKQEISGDAERPVAIAFSWAPAQPVDTPSDTPTIDANDAALKIVWDRDGTDGE